MYDVIIIGAGPTGIACALAAGARRLNYLVLEKGVLVNSLFNFPENMIFFSTSENLEIGNIPFISHSDKPSRTEALEYYRRVAASAKMKIQYRTEVLNVEKNGHFKLHTSRGDYEARSVVLATGFYDHPRKLNVPGEELPKVKHYYDSAHHYIDQRIVVVGGANSACDVALETWQKGAHVTMVVRNKDLYEKVKYWILPNIKNRIKEGSIQAFFQSEISRITNEQVEITTPKGKVVLDNDFVLAMTGYRPNYELLEKIGVEWHRDENQIPIFDTATFESNIPNLYIGGVLQGGLLTSKLFIENTRHHGDIIMDDVVRKAKKIE